MHALGVRRAVANPAQMITDAERAARRIQVFDGICAKHGYTPVLIAQLPTERLMELIGAEGHPVQAPPEAVAAWAREYFTAKTNAGRN